MSTTSMPASPSESSDRPQAHRVATAPAPLRRSRPRTRAKDVRHPLALADGRLRKRPSQLPAEHVADLDGDLVDDLAEELDAADDLRAAIESDHLAAVLPERSTDKDETKYLGRLNTKAWRATSKAVALTEVLNFADWLYRHVPDTDVRQVQPVHIRAYLAHLEQQGLTTTTTRLTLICLRVYYDFLTGTSKKRPGNNPARQVPLPQRELPLITPYSPTEAEAIFATIAEAAHAAYTAGDTAGWLLAERDYAMLATVRFAGIHRGELRRLRIRDVDLDGGCLHIKGKGARDRTITLPRVMLEVLIRYLTHVRRPGDSGQFLFCELDGLEWVYAGSDADHDNRYLTPELAEAVRKEDPDYGLGAETLTRRARFYARAAGIEGLHGAHRWRHTHASALAQAGMSLADIAGRLGHDLRKRQDGAIGWTPITLYYVSLSKDYLAEVVETALPNPLTD